MGNKSESEKRNKNLKQIINLCNFDNIRSKYILKQVFDNLRKNKTLKIIKNCLKIQKRLDININDYIEYSEACTSLEIELIPKKNKYGKFINISNKEDAKFFHIYFNNGKTEIKRNEIIKYDRVSKIRIILDYQIKSFNKLFKDCGCIEAIAFKKFCRNNINDMSYMFSGCSSLKELNLSNFNTHNVTDMSYMFNGCLSLKELDLSNFDTNNVINMNFMFYECSEELKNEVKKSIPELKLK